MGKKSKEVKYTPVLNANLLEGAFVGAMEQVFESINICNQHKSTSMSLEENVRALHEIAKAEMDANFAMCHTLIQSALMMMFNLLLWVGMMNLLKLVLMAIFLRRT